MLEVAGTLTELQFFTRMSLSRAQQMRTYFQALWPEGPTMRLSVLLFLCSRKAAEDNEGGHGCVPAKLDHPHQAAGRIRALSAPHLTSMRFRVGAQPTKGSRAG